MLAKIDIPSIFHNILAHPYNRHLLWLIWNGQLFVNTILPFGLHSGPIIFNCIRVAEAIQWIACNCTGFQFCLHHKHWYKQRPHYYEPDALPSPQPQSFSQLPICLAYKTPQQMHFPGQFFFLVAHRATNSPLQFPQSSQLCSCTPNFPILEHFHLESSVSGSPMHTVCVIKNLPFVICLTGSSFLFYFSLTSVQYQCLFHLLFLSISVDVVNKNTANSPRAIYIRK